MYVNRDPRRDLEDDFKLNVLPLLRDHQEAVVLLDLFGEIVGWKVQVKYE